MKDLRDAMLDAGAPRDDWNAEIPALIAAGQKRVRRRKIIAAGATAAVVAIVGTTAVLAGLPGLNRADPDPVEPDKAGVYVEERLAPEEVERRCNLVANDGTGSPVSYVAGVDSAGRATKATDSVEPVENRVGHQVAIAEEGDDMIEEDGSLGNSWRHCTIPQLEFMANTPGEPTEMPDPADAAAVLQACSGAGLYDFRFWSVLTVASADGRLDAVIMSLNGYSVGCMLEPSGGRTEFLGGRYRSDDGRTQPLNDQAALDDSHRYASAGPRCLDRDYDAAVECDAVGVVRGLPDDHQVEYSLSNGSVLSRTRTDQGAFVLIFDIRAKDMALAERDGVRLLVTDASGEAVVSANVEIVRPWLFVQPAAVGG